jgi:hypothetical protein
MALEAADATPITHYRRRKGGTPLTAAKGERGTCQRVIQAKHLAETLCNSSRSHSLLHCHVAQSSAADMDGQRGRREGTVDFRRRWLGHTWLSLVLGRLSWLAASLGNRSRRIP